MKFSDCAVGVSGFSYQVSCFFVGVNVYFLIKRAKLVDLPGLRGFFKLSVGYGDIALFGIKEAPGNEVSRENHIQRGQVE